MVHIPKTTDQAIAAFNSQRRQFLCYEIYRVDDKVWGHKIDWKAVWECKRDYPYCFEVSGKTMTFFVFTCDPILTQEHATMFAKAVYLGQIVQKHVDLTDL